MSPVHPVIAYTLCDSLILFTQQHWKLIDSGKLLMPEHYLLAPKFLADSVFMNTLMQSNGKRHFDDCIFQLDDKSVRKYFGPSPKNASGALVYFLSGKYGGYDLQFIFGADGRVADYNFGHKID